MRKTLVLIALLAIFTLGLALVAADEPEPGSPEDNACNTGGALEGRCDTEWHWVCGWYLAYWQAAGGWNNNAFFPDWCDPASLLPPRPVTNVATLSLAGCYTDGGDWSFSYSGISGSQITWYEFSTDCSGTLIPGWNMLSKPLMKTRPTRLVERLSARITFGIRPSRV